MVSLGSTGHRLVSAIVNASATQRLCNLQPGELRGTMRRALLESSRPISRTLRRVWGSFLDRPRAVRAYACRAHHNILSLLGVVHIPSPDGAQGSQAQNLPAPSLPGAAVTHPARRAAPSFASEHICFGSFSRPSPHPSYSELPVNPHLTKEFGT